MTEPERVTRLFGEADAGPEDTQVSRSFPGVARAVAQIAATRMLLLITVLTGSGLWAWTIYDPTHDRLYAAVAFSIVFMLPQVILYLKRG